MLDNDKTGSQKAEELKIILSELGLESKIAFTCRKDKSDFVKEFGLESLSQIIKNNF